MDIPTLRLGFVPGVEPDRFARRWREGRRKARLDLVAVPWSRQQEALDAGEVDMCFVRLPLADADGLHVVRLWEELPVVVVGEEDLLSLHEDLVGADLADSVAIPPAHPDDAAERVAVAATGAGHARMPMSLARLHHRKDAVHRVLRDGEPTTIALAWPAAQDDALRQEVVGVVRGRTARSSRSAQDQTGEAGRTRDASAATGAAGTAAAGRGTSRSGGARSGGGRGRTGKTGNTGKKPSRRR